MATSKYRLIDFKRIQLRSLFFGVLLTVLGVEQYFFWSYYLQNQMAQSSSANFAFIFTGIFTVLYAWFAFKTKE